MASPSMANCPDFTCSLSLRATHSYFRAQLSLSFSPQGSTLLKYNDDLCALTSTSQNIILSLSASPNSKSTLSSSFPPFNLAHYIHFFCNEFKAHCLTSRYLGFFFFKLVTLSSLSVQLIYGIIISCEESLKTPLKPLLWNV